MEKERADGLGPHREVSARHRAAAQRKVGIRDGGNATLAVAIRRSRFKPTFPHHPPELRRNDPKSRLWKQWKAPLSSPRPTGGVPDGQPRATTARPRAAAKAGTAKSRWGTRPRGDTQLGSSFHRNWRRGFLPSLTRTKRGDAESPSRCRCRWGCSTAGMPPVERASGPPRP